jgi:hypothetical protein
MQLLRNNQTPNITSKMHRNGRDMASVEPLPAPYKGKEHAKTHRALEKITHDNKSTSSQEQETVHHTPQSADKDPQQQQ